MATALLAGLLGASRTGEGCDVDVCLFDTALHQLSYPATWYLNQGHVTGRLPRGAHPSIAPSQLVKTQEAGACSCVRLRILDALVPAYRQRLRGRPALCNNSSRSEHLAL